MPKLNTEQLMERLERRIHKLELGEEIAAKDIKALLSSEQQQQLVDALAAQVALKKNKRACTDAEKQALGWKSIREVRVILPFCRGLRSRNVTQPWPFAALV
ncbi:hypothetical protein [Shewanella sp.]|uniref:hypothetical protein n=1 Tax=Shewanella sp. TaxID=50422 RepID=UPI0040481A83